MDWLQKMNAAIAYVETHLEDDIDLKEAGRIAGCSAYHFQRVFAYMANVSFAEYVRRRRLTLAAFTLQQTSEKVIDIALRFGYESPTSFTRAFAALHGITPKQARNEGVTFTAFPPLSFQISVQGVTAMNYRIETKEAFRTVGYKMPTTIENDRCWQEVPAFWGEIGASGKLANLFPLMDHSIPGVFGISVGDYMNNTNTDYYIAVASTAPAPEGMEEYTVPAATWAVFESVGPMPEAIQALQKRIFTEWLPTSGYEYANAPDIEVYGEGDQTAADYKCWVWFPVVKK